MTIQARIDELNAQAEPLRGMEGSDELSAIVDEINRLRALQSLGEELDVEPDDKPKRGRPPKVKP